MASPRRRLSAALVAAGLAALLGLATPRPAEAAPADLVGTFTVEPGRCNGAPSGSYFRMILPSGGANGPFIDNGDSACGDKTYTLFTPGTEGGLVSGAYQPAPTPGFDGDGNSLANRIIQPVSFFGKKFSLSTNPTDLQVGQAVPVPVIRADGDRLSGDLTAFNATWNRQAFNQGAPKPGGGSPGNTSPVTGTYDAATGRYTLTWQSQIVGGPFDNFTGQWHLEGTFRPAATGTATGTGGAATAGGSTVTSIVTESTPGAPVAAPAAGPAATTTTVAPLDGEQALGATTVVDDSFQVPALLVVGIALLGIAGVVVLVLSDRRPEPEEAS